MAVVGCWKGLNMEFDLTVLKRAANEACKMAFEARFDINGPINWGDLGCATAERYQDEAGRIGFRVLIEEAAPEAHELQEYIACGLAEMGCLDVEVLTEW